VTGLSGATSSTKYFKIDVPTGQTSLVITMSGGTGDADLYVRSGSKPTLTEWDYRPYLIGNNETVTINNPTGGTYYIMLNGYAAYSGVTLVATYTGAPETVTELTNGVPVTGLSAATGTETFYKIVVPAGQDFLHIEISGGTGDCDLYVKRGTKPTQSSWDYRPYLIGNNESVDVTSPAAGTWYIMLHAFQAYSGVTLVASYGVTTPPGNIFSSDPNCVAVWNLEPTALGVDSKGTNNLTNTGVTSNTSDFRQGTGSGDFESTDVDFMTITDADLSSKFPLKSGTNNKKLSITTWCKLESVPGPFGSMAIWSKAGWTVEGQISAMLLVDRLDGTGPYFTFLIGHTFGNAYEAKRLPSLIVSTGVWYHIAVTFNDADKSYRISVYDAGADLSYQTNGTMTNNIVLSSAPVRLGIRSASSGYAPATAFDGLMDEVVVFNDTLTTTEISDIREGTYGHP
jgi:hypothetical protein